MMSPTEKQMEILQFISEGYEYKDIGQKLGISEGAIKNHMWRCFYKIGAINAPNAMAIAMREGYIK